VTYYVNDFDGTGDQYCTALGNDSNDGLSPDAPKGSVQAVMDAYDLEPGDVIWVDSGVYGAVSVGAGDSGVRVVGPAAPGVALVEATADYVVYLYQVTDVTLERLAVRNRYAAGYGVYLNNCDRCGWRG